MSSSQTIDITGDVFARRFANLLRDRRETLGASHRDLARGSRMPFSARFLRSVEEGRAQLDEETICELAELYGADLAEILPSRLPLQIPEPGVLATSGITVRFDDDDRDSLLTTYLVLVRQLRAQEREPMIDLRREDVETIAEYLHEPGATVLDRLGALMGATVLHRRAMAGMFIAGAIVIGLAGSGVAAFSGTIANNSVASQLPVTPVIVTTSVPDRIDRAVVTSTTAPSESEPTTTAAAPVDHALPVVPRSADYDGAVAPAPTSTIVPPDAIVTPPSVAPTATPASGTGTPVVSTTAPADAATDDPPVPVPTTEVAVVEPTIPDLPYDLPTTSAAPTSEPQTEEPPVPTTQAPPTSTDSPPTETTQVAVGDAPVPTP